jgi:hypothetical protein
LLTDGGQSTGQPSEEEEQAEPAPRLNSDYPIETGDQLSIPYVRSPLYTCAQAVFVSGFVPGALVRVYANGTEIGQETPHLGYAKIEVDRPLKQGETVTATQQVDGKKSAESLGVTVQPFDGDLPTPVIKSDPYECGQIVNVGNAVSGATIEVFENGSKIGEEATAGEFESVNIFPSEFSRGATVRARLVRCTDGPGDEVEGQRSEPATVQPEPSPVTAPNVEPPTVGNDTVTMDNLYLGALARVRDRGNRVGGGLATGSRNWTRVDPPVSKNSNYTATQELCSTSPSSGKTPSRDQQLQAPQIETPICPGTQYLRIANTTVNARVVLFVDGQIAGYGGAVPGELILGVGGGNTLQPGQTVEAVQYMGSNVSPQSNTETVSQGLPPSPDVTVQGGQQLIDSNTEEPFEGFVRETASGVTVRTTTCCEEGGVAVFIGPEGNELARIELTEVYQGYYEAEWDWTSEDVERSSLRPGTYTVRVETNCAQDPAETTFRIVIGRPNRDDMSPPNVRFTANVNGTTYTLTDGDQNAITDTFKPSGDINIDATVVGRDADGVKRTKLITSGIPSSATINGQTVTQSPPRAPIPTQLSVDPLIQNVEPPATVVLRGEAQNFGGSPSNSRSTPELRLRIEEPPQPPSVSLQADPNEIFTPAWSTALLKWSASNANQVQINQGIGQVANSGSKRVDPNANTTYRIVATGSGGQASDTATVRVRSQISRTTNLGLVHDAQASANDSSGREIFEQQNPTAYISNSDIQFAIGRSSQDPEVTGVVNSLNRRIVVAHEAPNGLIRSTGIIPSSGTSNALNGMSYEGLWEVYTDGIRNPPGSISIQVSWELQF